MLVSGIFHLAMLVIQAAFRINGINLLMFMTFSSLFTDVYNFLQSNDGLAFIEPGVRYLVAALFGGQISSRIYSIIKDFSKNAQMLLQNHQCHKCDSYI